VRRIARGSAVEFKGVLGRMLHFIARVEWGNRVVARKLVRSMVEAAQSRIDQLLWN